MSEAIINQAWEDVADDVTGAIEKAVQPLLKKAVDDIYGGLLDATQDYLKDNLAFNIASRISTAEREEYASRRRAEVAEKRVAELEAAIRKDAARFEHCADMIAESFNASGTLRAERTIKAQHYALEARALGTPASEGEE